MLFIQVRKCLRERREASLLHGIVFFAHEHADAPHAVALLRSCRERPDRRAPEPRYERPASHWITSSAVANSVSGMVRPSVLAVFRLMTSSYLIGCRCLQPISSAAA